MINNDLMLKRIKALLTEKGISQRELQRIIGLSTGSISKWKSSSPSADALIKIANYFDVDVKYLIGESDIRHQLNSIKECDNGYSIHIITDTDPNEYQLNVDPEIVETAIQIQNQPELKKFCFLAKNALPQNILICCDKLEELERGNHS